MSLGDFKRTAPQMTRGEASHFAMRALIEMLEAEGERSLSEDEKRRIFLRHHLWVPSKRHWRMDQLPHYRDRDRGGKLVALRPSTG